ncbi:MAG: hypothetical protein H7259_01495 [Cytophagales bacterium]|nr:hypothetical protein [Cytophaga sp.]
MDKNSILLLFTSLFFFFACRREYSASEVDTICNQTSRSLHIDYYKDGIADNSLSIDSIKRNACKQVYSANGMGSTSNYINTIIDIDSIVITYYDGIQIVHYGYFMKSGLNSKALQFNNTRNLLNGQNWTPKITNGKHSKSSELSFVVTEQDYLDAK